MNKELKEDSNNWLKKEWIQKKQEEEQSQWEKGTPKDQDAPSFPYLRDL